MLFRVSGDCLARHGHSHAWLIRQCITRHPSSTHSLLSSSDVKQKRKRKKEKERNDTSVTAYEPQPVHHSVSNTTACTHDCTFSHVRWHDQPTNQQQRTDHPINSMVIATTRLQLSIERMCVCVLGCFGDRKALTAKQSTTDQL